MLINNPEANALYVSQSILKQTTARSMNKTGAEKNNLSKNY